MTHRHYGIGTWLVLTALFALPRWTGADGQDSTVPWAPLHDARGLDAPSESVIINLPTLVVEETRGPS